jgi:hypothetical protein
VDNNLHEIAFISQTFIYFLVEYLEEEKNKRSVRGIYPQGGKKMVGNSIKNQQEENNKKMIEEIEGINDEFTGEMRKLKNSLWNTRRLIIALSVVMLFLGVVLLFAPFLLRIFVSMDEFLVLKDEFQWQLLVLQGFGIVDIVALFVYNPVKRIHNLIRDVSLTILVFNSYQVQLKLFLSSKSTENTSKSTENTSKSTENTSKSTENTSKKEVVIPEKIGIETRKYIETIKDCFAEEE